MPRLKCKKCGNVFELKAGSFLLSIHLGPYHWMKCPACFKSGFFNVYSSVKEQITWPKQETNHEKVVESGLSEEELENNLIEESKYEKM